MQSLKLNIHVRTAEIHSSFAPDHQAIYSSDEINDAFQLGLGTWQFNINQLLEDENYVQLITEC